jgi:UbiD family decarboxylase
MEMATGVYDLRSFIQKLEEAGELVRVKAEVYWKYELGGIALKCAGRKVGPALLFENIKGYRTPLFTGGLLTVKRLAIALGMDPATPQSALQKEAARRLEKPLKPRLLQTGPCKENKMLGKDVDVFKFPVPWWTERDGGRYIGTWHQVIAKDPESDWVNVGTYRMMAHNGNTLGLQHSPFQHVAMIHAKYKAMNKPMPIAVTIGNDPVCPLVSITPFPAGVSEWEMAGALRGKPLDVVKGETVDLPVPANAEIVIEGEVPVDEKWDEGPFGEHTGFYGGGKRPLPIVKVNCVTYRNNPIFRGSILGRPITEDHTCLSFTLATQALLMFKNSGFPGIIDVSCPAGGDPDFCAIISLKKSHPSQGLDAGRMLLSGKGGKIIKHVIVVDEDINVFSLDEVLWAMNTRMQASRQVYITRNESGSRLDPSVPFDWLGLTDKMIIDTTWPSTPDFPARPEWDGAVHPPEVKISESLEKMIEKRWPEYGIKF